MTRAPTMLLLAFLAGCGASPTRVTAAPPPPTSGGVVVIEVGTVGNGNPGPSPAMSPRTVRLVWTEIQATDGCFFFSGPEALGRDDHLGVSAVWLDDGRSAQLAFDRQVVFTGYAPAATLVLTRTSAHEYGGDPWSVRETLALEDIGRDERRGRYHYDELDLAGAPSGNCHIDAFVTMLPL